MNNDLRLEISLHGRDETSSEHHLGVRADSPLHWVDGQLVVVALNMEDGSVPHLVPDMDGLILGFKSNGDISEVKELLYEDAFGLIDDTLALDIDAVSIFDLEDKLLLLTSLASGSESYHDLLGRSSSYLIHKRIWYKGPTLWHQPLVPR